MKSTGDPAKDFEAWWPAGQEWIAQTLHILNWQVHKDICALAFGVGWGAGMDAAHQPVPPTEPPA